MFCVVGTHVVGSIRRVQMTPAHSSRVHKPRVHRSPAIAPVVAAVLGLSVAGLAGCAQSPDGGTSADLSDIKACLVSGADGYSSAGGTLASQGLDRAASELGVQTGRAEAHAASDYATGIQAMVSAGCGYVIGISPDQSDALAAAARANPDVHFALVGATKDVAEDNLKLVKYQSPQAGFLAGYLAAASSQSGTVGTFGATNTPAVTLYMDGFSQGVNYFNQQKPAQVKVVGWTAGSQSGAFVGGADATGDTAGAAAQANALIAQGADVVMPVAGAANSGAAQAAGEHPGVRVIGTGDDLCTADSQTCSVTLATAGTAVDAMVFELVKQLGEGFTSDTLVATLDNQGVALMSVGKDASVSQDVSDQLEQVRQAVAAGTVKVTSPSTVS